MNRLKTNHLNKLLLNYSYRNALDGLHAWSITVYSHDLISACVSITSSCTIQCSEVVKAISKEGTLKLTAGMSTR